MNGNDDFNDFDASWPPALLGPSDSSAVVRGDLDQRMEEAGMMPVSEMLERSGLGHFSAHAGVTDLETFEQWIQKKREEFIRMQARMNLDNEEKDELYEWVIAHNAVLGEVIANFRQATGRNP